MNHNRAMTQTLTLSCKLHFPWMLAAISQFRQKTGGIQYMWITLSLCLLISKVATAVMRLRSMYMAEESLPQIRLNNLLIF